ncbi:hypothetical protein B5M09_008923 [Aphanomyces astaci]|uniref:Bromo domain-containing protein n=1 Tax=Aphanomyces astaci TaxID=112090 RepID=A0A425CZ22_APHAT|nr:hypothetical protein B5M09_008923 [Aphanomyces astaci]
MLGIHTKKWQPPLSTSFKDQLAKDLVGYCGADIKALCAETALVAFKRAFPQVYDTPAKLDVDLSQLHVLRGDFHAAQAKIVPAAARSQSVVATPLPPLLAPLLEEPLSQLVQLVQSSFPTGLFAPPPTLASTSAPIHDLSSATCSHCLTSLSTNAIQSCVSCHASFHTSCLLSASLCASCVPAYTYIPPSLVRCLVFGSSGAMGQSVVSSALLSHMDGFPVIEMDRFSPPSQWMAKWTEALARVPCVVYCPHVDQSWADHPTEIPAMLHHWLQSSAQHLPIVLVATASTTHLPPDLLALFPHQFQVTPPPESARRAFWSVLRTWASSPPPVPPPPPAPLRVLAPPLATDKPTPVVTLNDQEQHHLRELRIFLEAVVSYCIRQKANAPFVVIETVLDHGDDDDNHEHVTIHRHMDLNTIRDKLHDGEYTTWEKFMADVHEIVQDAYAAYPKYSPLRYIAHAAANMQDNVMSFAHRFRKEQGYDLFATCRAIQHAKLASRPVPAPMRLKRPGVQPPSIAPPPADLTTADDSVQIVDVFVVGDPVFVAKRTGPGMNKLGGAGRVQQVYEEDASGSGLKYDVKYILGGFEKEVLQ